MNLDAHRLIAEALEPLTLQLLEPTAPGRPR